MATSVAVVAIVAPEAEATEYEWLDATYGVNGLGGNNTSEDLFNYLLSTMDGAGRALVTTEDNTTDPAQYHMRRLTVDGAPDPTFAGGDLTLPNPPAAVVADDAGAVTIASVVSGTGVVVSRYTSAGVLDPDFGVDGSVIALAGSGDMYPTLALRSGGLFVTVTNNNFSGPRTHVVALTDGGDLDDTWGSGGVLAVDDLIESVVAQGDSAVAIDLEPSPATLIRFSSDGELDAGFGGPIDLMQYSAGVKANGDGYYVYGEVLNEETTPTTSFPAVVRYTSSGDVDTSFGSAGLAQGVIDDPMHSSVYPFSLHFASGFIYLTGRGCCGETPTHVNRFTTSGVLDTGYGVGGEVVIDEIGGVHGLGVGLGVQPSGRLLVLFSGHEYIPEEDQVIPHSGVVRLLNDEAGAAGSFVALSPSRILDTRSGNGAAVGKVAPNGVLELQVTGRGGVPASGVAAVVLNVTVTGAEASGYVTVFPTGTSAPTASNLNFSAAQTIPNLVVVKLGTDGKVSLKNGSATGATHLVADVAGYFLAGTPVAAGTFAAVDPARILDTRNGNGAPTGKVGPGGVMDLQVTGRGGVPASGVAAVVMNVTVTGAEASGYVTVFPTGTSAPTASNLNFVAGKTVPNLVVVKLGTDGKVSLKNGSATGATHLIADVAGYFLAGTPTAPGAFVAVDPARILDTRNGNGAPTGKVSPGAVVDLQVTGRGGVPGAAVSAVFMNVTVTGAEASGYVTAYPTGTSAPTASNLNFVAGKTVPNLVGVKLGTGGKVSLKNGSSTGSTHLIADVAGYFLS